MGFIKKNFEFFALILSLMISCEKSKYKFQLEPLKFTDKNIDFYTLDSNYDTLTLYEVEKLDSFALNKFLNYDTKKSIITILKYSNKLKYLHDNV